MDKEIFEGNKLIAEFDGWIMHDGKYWHKERNITMYHEPKDFQYHSSWDWLLPAVKKFKEYLNKLERPSKNHCCQGDLLEVDVICSLQEVNIEKCFKSLLLCIKWFNSQKQGVKA